MSKTEAAKEVMAPTMARCECTAEDVISVLWLTAMKTVFGGKRVVAMGTLCRRKKIMAQLCYLNMLSPKTANCTGVCCPINGSKNGRCPLESFSKYCLYGGTV
jgi:hypothetical protein